MMTNPQHARGVLGGTRVSRSVSDFGFSWTRLKPGLHLPLHAHSSATLNLVLRGEYGESLLGRRQMHGPMTVIGKPASMEHTNTIGRNGATCLVLEIPAQRLSSLGLTRGLQHPFTTPAGEIGLLGLRALRELNLRDSHSAVILEGIALEILGLVARHGVAREPVTPAWLRQIRDAVRASVESGAKPHRLEELGRMAGRHPVYVARAFRHQFGQSIGAYTRSLRVEQARRDLLAGHSLSAIAARAGFADQSHFSRVFRRQVGVSPAEFRRQTR